MKRDWSNSKAAFEQACHVIPGGVNSPARAFGAVGGTPLFIERGEGPRLFDIDGNSYLDYIGSWGPLILGHRHPAVVAALTEKLQTGTTFGAPTSGESKLAEQIVQAVPSIEMVRLTSSGTEASMSAVRVARGYTGRAKIIKFAGCYHGHVDCLLVQAGSAATTLGVPSSPGVPAGATADTIVLPFNDLDAVKSTFAEHGADLAAVLLEPVVGNMGLVPPLPGFLEGLREITAKYGTVLIFDEVMTGFRLALGGAQERYGVTPDMSVLGKIIGGGLPVGAYGGKKEIMQVVSPLGPVYQAGTLSGNPLAVAAGSATLHQLMTEPPYERLETLSAKLAEGLDKAATDAKIPHTVPRVGSMITLYFNPEPVHNYEQAKKSDTALFARFFWNMMERGVYWPCSQFEALFVSAAHSEADIDATIDAARHSLAALNS